MQQDNLHGFSESRKHLSIAKMDNPSGHPAPELSFLAADQSSDSFLLQFQAMASTCELLIDLPESHWALAEQLALQAVRETWRIEFKFSRYQTGNWHDEVHQNRAHWQNLDEESARLIAFADQAWRLSDGLFDITSGILRKVWRFDGGDRLPEPEQVKSLLPQIGWQKVQWSLPDDDVVSSKPAQLYLPDGMELDFGGLGKEYAVDRVLGLSLNLLQKAQPDVACSVLVNFGGDIACSGPRANGEPWKVGIEAPDREGNEAALLSLTGGALATSGDSQRYLLKEDKRYSHLLNPKTGWPIENAVRSITVAAPTCSQGGLISSLALLQGAGAEDLLKQTGLKYWLLSA